VGAMEPPHDDTPQTPRRRRRARVPAVDPGPDTDAVSAAAIRRWRFAPRQGVGRSVVEDNARRLLAFRLTQEVLQGRRGLDAMLPALEEVRRADAVFEAVLARVSPLTPSAVAVAEVLLSDGFSGDVDDLLRTSDLLSN
jgi:hypothetical protein